MSNDTVNITSHLPGILPPSLLELCIKYLDSYYGISEIRLRRNRPVVFSNNERNIVSSYVCNDALFDNCLSLWLGKERYKQSDNLTEGVIALPHGFRVGIAGTALTNKKELINVYEITTANVRLPRFLSGISLPLYEYISTLNYTQRSTLIIAPPCNGKSTVLRDLARILSTPPVSERVCVVDPKRELAPLEDKPCLHMDVFTGYPTPIGLNTAVRYFSPRYIICDEIGREDELAPIRNVAHSGIPLIASTHSPSLSDLILKPVIRALLTENVFCNVVALSLNNNGLKFEFFPKREVDRILCTPNLLLP